MLGINYSACQGWKLPTKHHIFISVISKTLAILFSLLYLGSSLIAQNNLVPNHSFEENDSCGDGFRGIDPLCKHWFTPMSLLDTAFIPFIPNHYGSSDYYNTCNNNEFQTPSNYFGYQTPISDSSYAGFCLISVIHPPNFPNTNYKEYIEVQLKSTLKKDKEYCLEFYYSIATYLNYENINIQALITDTIVKRSPHNLYWFNDIHAAPQISFNLPIVPDTFNWIKVTETYTAAGDEKFITIGNFDNTDHIDPSLIYIYIDDVKLWYCGPDTSGSISDKISIYPNPFSDILTIDFKDIVLENSNLILYDVFGRKVYDDDLQLTLENKASLSFPQLSIGTYFYELRIENRKIKTGKLIKI